MPPNQPASSPEKGSQRLRALASGLFHGYLEEHPLQKAGVEWLKKEGQELENGWVLFSVLAIGLVTLTGWGIHHQMGKTIGELNQKIKSNQSQYDTSLAQKNSENLQLRTELTPFRTVAIERFGGTEAEALSKLASQLKDIQSTVSALQNYSDTAKLNLFGLTGAYGFGLVEQTSISVHLQGCYTNWGGLTHPLCTPESESKFLTTINKFPDFPFSYYAIASCYKAQGKANWRDYAVKALAILDQTTTIKGHHPQHDEARQQLRDMLSLREDSR